MASKAPPPLPPSSISRRQPPRQARTAPRKNMVKAGPSRGEPTSSLQPPKKFYPALSAFTDAIDALPAEIIRHFTLLREVDAKACVPETNLRALVDACEALSPPAAPSESDPALQAMQLLSELRRNRENPLYAGSAALLADLERVEAMEVATPGCRTILGRPETRRARAAQIRAQINDLLSTQDEKIHVITTAVDALRKHLARVEHCFAYTEIETPEIYRLGNKEHWAYKDPMRKGTAAAQARQAERDRREAEERFHAQQQREAELNTRGEGKREKKATHRHDDEPIADQHKKRKMHKDAETLVSAKRLAEQQVAAQQKKRKTTKEDPRVKDKLSAAGVVAASPRASTPAVLAGNTGGGTKKSKMSVTMGNSKSGGKRNTTSAANSPRIGPPAAAAVAGSSPPPPSSQANNLPPPHSLAPAAAHQHVPQQQPHASPSPEKRRSPSPMRPVSAKKPKTKPRQTDKRGHGGEDGEEQTYCYCNQISYGEMVACDGEDCEREWFHLQCVGLSVAPRGKTKWYCEACKAAMDGRRRIGSRQ